MNVIVARGAVLAIALLAACGTAQAGMIDEWTRVQAAWDARSPAAEARTATLIAEAAGDTLFQRVGRLNRAANLALHPAADDGDHWASPDEVLAGGRGDCEDYAIAKMAVLERMGVASELVVVLTPRGAHAVLQVMIDGQARILDNLTNAMAGEPPGEVLARFKRK